MYIISIFAVIIISKLLTAGNSGLFWPADGLTMMIILLFDFTLLAGVGLLKDFNNAFRLGLRRKPGKESVDELRRAIEAVRLTRKVTLITAVFLLTFEITQIMSSADLFELEDLGGMLSPGLTALPYASAITLVLLPMESTLKSKLWDAQKE